MFRFTQEPSSGSWSQCLAEITSMVPLCLFICALSDRYRGLGFDSRRFQIFWVVVGLERGPLNLVRSIEELLEKGSGSGPENRD